MPTEEILRDFYLQYKDPRARSEVVIENARRNASKLVAEYGWRPEAHLLDYGCGENLFVQTAGHQNWIGYDPHKSHADNKTVLTEGFFDFVTMWGVLEHVTDPVGTLKILSSRMARGAKIALTTVWTQREIPYQYKPPEHLTYWSSEAIQLALHAAGFVNMVCLPYRMVQHRDVYFPIILRAGRVPEQYRPFVTWSNAPELLDVPTNEMFVVATKT